MSSKLRGVDFVIVGLAVCLFSLIIGIGTGFYMEYIGYNKAVENIGKTCVYILITLVYTAIIVMSYYVIRELLNLRKSQ